MAAAERDRCSPDAAAWRDHAEIKDGGDGTSRRTWKNTSADARKPVRERGAPAGSSYTPTPTPPSGQAAAAGGPGRVWFPAEEAGDKIGVMRNCIQAWNAPSFTRRTRVITSLGIRS